MGLFNRLKKKKIELYDESELNELENFIDSHIGHFNEVFHEIYSPDIHLDIAIVHPTDGHPYYSLVTMGLGAHSMNVPKKFKKYEFERCELVIDLPADWNIKSNEEKWYWPIRWLKIIARCPIEQNTWIGYGHTFGDGSCFDDSVSFTSIALTQFINEPLQLSHDKKIHFYHLIPLYPEELDYKMNKGDLDAFLDIADDLSTILDIHRKNYCKTKE